MTIWPSRIARTASAIGSLWSSPSTSTVKMPVMVPSPGPGAGPLQEPRQLGEHRRRIALGGRRLAGGKPDLALRHGKAGDRIHQQQHVLALVAEIFGDGERQIGRPGGASAPARRRSRPPPPSGPGPPRRDRPAGTPAPRGRARRSARSPRRRPRRCGPASTAAPICRRPSPRKCPCAGRGSR